VHSRRRAPPLAHYSPRVADSLLGDDDGNVVFRGVDVCDLGTDTGDIAVAGHLGGRVLGLPTSN
jgi:hypothetical protein